MNGILLVDKPKGWTSHDVVAKVRNILSKEAGQKVKVGHTGTLDPLASGLMVLVVGSYCKRASEFSKLDKTYEAIMKLGETSNTGDEEGEKTKISEKKPTKKEILEVFSKFTGEIEQVPPVFSAIKIDGKRAYQLARGGKEVELKSRKITIYGIELGDYSYPEVSCVTNVSSGTYIRSLAGDIGEELKTGAYLSGLRRVEVGEFKIKNAHQPTECAIDKITKL